MRGRYKDGDPLSDHDLKKIEEARIEIAQKAKDFWTRYKITDAEVSSATSAYQTYLKTEPESITFAARSPMAYRMFVLGWSWGRR